MRYRGAVLDLDGTVYRGGELVPGAAAAVDRLRERGLALVFLSNNPTKSRRDYVERLRDFGIEAREEEILSSGTLTARYLAEHHADDRLFVVGSSGLREQLRAAGLVTTDDPERAEAVVGSFYRGFDYDTLRESYYALRDGVPFVGTDPDMVVPVADGVVPGSGAIIRSMAGIAERDPDRVLGKPSPEAAETVLDALGTQPEETLVVGDRPGTDITLGERVGATTVLVLSGVTDRDDLADSSVDRDYVLDSLADIETVLDE